MYLHNQTAMQFLVTDKHLITRVVYQVDQDMQIVANETYRQDFHEKIKLESQASLQIHDLPKEVIRAVQLEHKSIQYKALNAQTFWGFVKDQWRPNKQLPQTVARFTLPILKNGEMIKTNIKHTIEFRPLPWEVKAKSEFRERVIEPEIYQLDLYLKTKTLSAILAYPLESVSSLIVTEGCLS